MRSFTDEESRETRLQVRTVVPAKVISYNRATQRAKIELSQKTVVRFEDGTEVEQNALVFENVPVKWPGSASNYAHFDLSPGDTGAAVVCDRSIAAWRTDGEAHAPQLPSLHNLADCYFDPGLKPDSAPLFPPPPGGATIESDTISLGAAAVLGVARLNDSVTSSAAFTTWLAAVSTALGALGQPVGPAPAGIGSITSASSKVKAE